MAQQLLQEIRDKQLAAGTRMPSERELMAGLGVGRSTIREAINGLAMLGVLELRHGLGAFVADAGGSVRELPLALARGITPELFEARRLVEVEAARLAAERRTANDLRDIAEVLASHERALSSGAPAVDPSIRFHTLLAEAAHSDVLAGFVESLAEPLAERGAALEAMPGFRESELDHHRAVFECVEAGDGCAAAERMRAHLDAVLPYHERLGQLV